MRANWRPLFAATFGLGTGSTAIALYSTSVIAPNMIAELGWSKATFAMLGVMSIVSSLCFPVIGRVADLMGVKRTATIGIVVLPLCLFAYSLMTGPVWQYVVIHIVSSMLCMTTTTMIYTRVAVQYTNVARGLALAIISSGPAVTGVALGPITNMVVEAEGWRTAYHVLAVVTVVTGAITLLLLPREGRPATGGEAGAPRRRVREDYPLIFRTPVFWLLLAAMVACNIPQILSVSQMKLLLIENGITGTDTSLMVAAVPAGVLLGRFVAGAALDRFPAHLVGFITTGLPSIGLLLFASGLDSTAVLTLAVLCMGFSIGAEGDVMAFIVARKFGIEIYSSVMGLLTTAISLSMAISAVILSFTLEQTGTFHAFLLISAAAVISGSLLILMIGNSGRLAHGHADAVLEA